MNVQLMDMTLQLPERAVALVLALSLDAACGEPRWLWSRLPHPVILMGRLIDWLDRRGNVGRLRRLRGGVAIGVAVLLAAMIAAAIAAIPFAGLPLSILLAAMLLAQASLVAHVGAVAEALPRSLESARREIARIVGRDPDRLDKPAIARAAIESAAENFSDAVIAPAFWFLLAGLPGLVVCKMVNTADSMIGHKTERHHAFGWASARLDDLLNIVPARLAGLLIAASALSVRALVVMVRDAGRHRSPNAGWPEAAMAGALDVRLAGPRIYEGVATDDPPLNAGGRGDPDAADIRRAIVLLWRGWALLMLIVILFALFP